MEHQHLDSVIFFIINNYFQSKQLGQYLGFSQMGILVSQNLHIITEVLLFICQWLLPA
jgi:hypothetical protein